MVEIRKSDPIFLLTFNRIKPMQTIYYYPDDDILSNPFQQQAYPGADYVLVAASFCATGVMIACAAATAFSPCSSVYDSNGTAGGAKASG